MPRLVEVIDYKRREISVMVQYVEDRVLRLALLESEQGKVMLGGN